MFRVGGSGGSVFSYPRQQKPAEDEDDDDGDGDDIAKPMQIEDSKKEDPSSSSSSEIPPLDFLLGDVCVDDGTKMLVIRNLTPPLDLTTQLLEIRDPHFRFRWTMLPASLPGFPSHVMRSVVRDRGLSLDLRQKRKTFIYLQTILPIPVHVSPIYALFCAHYQAPSDCKDPSAVLGQPREWICRITSCLESAFYLSELLDLARNGKAVPTNLDAKEQARLERECHQRHRDGDTLTNWELDTLYDEVSQGRRSYENGLDMFVVICESSALRLIHLLEYELYQLLLAPYAPHVPALRDLMTPSQGFVASLAGLPSDVVGCIQKDALDFFVFKYVNADQAMDATHSKPPVMHRGVIPHEWIRRYFHFLDDESKCGNFLRL